MKERPMLFSSPMVRAILEGRKTQTRCVLKPQPPAWIDSFGYTAFTPTGSISGRGYWRGVPGEEGPGEKFFKCPYGKPGDRLWVRETFCPVHGIPGKFVADPDDFVRYRADDGDGERVISEAKCWKPSIFMPRAYSRITLEITDVRVERLQDISEDDAISEGLIAVQGGHSNGFMWNGPGYHDNVSRHSVTGERTYHVAKNGDLCCCKARPAITPALCAYRTLWDSINGEGAWDKNPWVWALTFKRLTRPAPSAAPGAAK